MDGLAIETENIQSAGENVQQWLEDLGITKETDMISETTQIVIRADGTEI